MPTKSRPSFRLARVAELIQREIGKLLINEVEDPRLKKVTLSRVKMSPDLRHARISFTVLNEEDAKYSAKALNKAANFFRRHIAKELELRVVPELFFVYDEALHEAEDLVNLINKL